MFRVSVLRRLGQERKAAGDQQANDLNGSTDEPAPKKRRQEAVNFISTIVFKFRYFRSLDLKF